MFEGEREFQTPYALFRGIVVVVMFEVEVQFCSRGRKDSVGLGPRLDDRSRGPAKMSAIAICHVPPVATRAALEIERM